MGFADRTYTGKYGARFAKPATIAAYAEFQEDVKGQLKEGMLADLVLLSEDLESLPVEEIKDVRPTLTMCDGVITYEA